MPGTTISGNSATANGGGINDVGTLHLMPTPTSTITISGNSAASGGGILVAGTLTDVGATYTGNSAIAGGGIAVLKGGTATLTGSTIAGNAAGTLSVAGSGGGIDNAGTLSLFEATIGSTTTGQTAPSNTSTGKGGGIDNEAGGTLTLSYSTVGNNAAAALGGGGVDNSGSATLSVTTLAYNTAATVGGGIAGELGSTLILSDSTLAHNSATTGGGGLSNAGTSTVTNATIASNLGGKGGGVYDTGVLTVNSSTIAYNSVAAGGAAGGLDAVSGSTILYNTIVAQNTSGVGSASDANGSLSPISAYDLFGTGGSGGLVASNGILVNVRNTGLGQLASDGGPTQTIALLAGSPAIDAGGASIPGDTVPNVDQRGALRGSAGLNAGTSPDIGAYEASSSYLVSTNTDTTLMGTLRSAIAWANASTNANPKNLAPGSAAPNTAVFDTGGLFATAQTIGISSALPTIVITDQSGSGVAIDGTASDGLTISGGGAAQLFSINAGANVTLSGLTLTGGDSALSGGAISNSGTLTIKDSTLTGNSAADSGGAIDDLGTLTLESSTFNANSAAEYGGAIDVESAGTLTATNSTFAGNAAAHGGGLYSTGTLTAVNDTIAYNTATAASAGGGLNAAGGQATLYNTIVASNSDSTVGTPADDIAGAVSGLSSYNLIGDGGSGGIAGGLQGNIVLNSTQSPGLAPGLGNNGGPTQTIALLPTSPAIGTALPAAGGTTVVYDQRGALRKSPAIDIGAFEYSSSYLVTTALDSTVPGTLRSAIAWADSDTGVTSSVPLTIEFDTLGLFATPQVINLGLGVIALTNTARPIVIEGPGAAIVTIDGDGASGVFSVATGVTAQISGVTISGGMAVAGGGINNAGALSVNAAEFAFNTTPSGSGAAISNTGTLAVSASGFSGNTGSYYGGAIFNDDGTATITNSNFVDNSTLYGLGGAIDNLGGSLTVTGATFQGNAAFQGGAIYNRNDATNNLPGTVTITAASILGNNAYQGGGVFNEGTMLASDDLIANNTAFQGGGVSNNFGGTTTIGDSTLAFNTAQQYGGAIDSVSTLTVVSSTIAYNVVASGGSGGGVDIYAGTAALYDTIAALNTIGTGKTAADNDLTGQVAAASSFNLIGKGGLNNGVNSNIVGVTNPGLAATLANNGGPTETLALIVGSPAIGAGSATIAGVAVPGADQRGVARPAIGFDIGAFQGAIAAPVSPTPITTAVVSAPAAVAADVLVSAASSSPLPSAGISGVAVIHGHTPFRGRNLHAKSHRQSKAGHTASVSHQAARTASPARRAMTIPFAKHNPR
jgi:hypothetical protein